MSDRGHFLNIDTLNRILFSQLTRFGKLSFFNFRPSFLSPDAFRSIGCIGCKLIFLADAPPSPQTRHIASVWVKPSPFPLPFPSDGQAWQACS